MFKKFTTLAAALAILANFATTPAAASASDKISQIARAHACTIPVQKSCKGIAPLNLAVLAPSANHGSAPVKAVPPYRSAAIEVNSALATTPTVSGIDVSWANQVDSFHQVVGAGVGFVFVKASEGETIQDPNFPGYRDRAESVGLPTWVYHLMNPGDTSSSQLQNYLSVVGNVRSNESLCVIDIEPDSGWLQLAQQTRIARVINFARDCQLATGFSPIIYVSPNVLQNYIGDATAFTPYGLWLAEYNSGTEPDVPAPFSSWRFWQYSDSGSVAGVENAVDQDLFNGNVTQLQAFMQASTQ